MLRPLAIVVMGLAAVLPARASASAGGGLVAPSASQHAALTVTVSRGHTGGVAFGEKIRLIAGRPEARLFALTPATLTAGDHPHVAVKIAESNAKSVRVRVTFVPIHGHGHQLSVDAGRVKVGTQVRIPWPSGASLAAGHYHVVLHAIGPGKRTLVRRAHASGRATLTVKAAPKPKVVKPVTPTTPTTTTPTTTTTTTTPTVTAPAASATGVFPVQGAHSYGDAFGAPRKGYSHQGQDILAALGTPVVAPVAGTIATTGYQASSAGYYVVENADNGESFFFAHCAHASTVVAPGQAVSQGGPICHVGQTGDATGPHLHFELWVGGWRVSKSSTPVDPLSQLQAWDH